MQNKLNRGLSQVVTITIFIVISIAAIGIFWFAIRDTINFSPETGCNPALKSYDIKITSACYNPSGEIKITLKREIDNLEINFLQFSFSNGETYKITGEKCLDVRTADQYGKTCGIISAGQEKSYFFSPEGEIEKTILLEAEFKEQDNSQYLCSVAQKEIKETC